MANRAERRREQRDQKRTTKIQNNGRPAANSATAEAAARYLLAYVGIYRQEYARLTAHPPDGGGYPALHISPYLSASRFQCHLATRGAAVAVILDAERAQEHVAGYATFALGSEVPDDIVTGVLPPPVEWVTASMADGHVTAYAARYDLPWPELVSRLTLGALGVTSEPGADFWAPTLIKNMCFSRIAMSSRKCYQYLEILHHDDASAWDVRSITARVYRDVRRDFAGAFSTAGSAPGGSFTISGPAIWPFVPFHDRLTTLDHTIEAFRTLLNDRATADEAVFHDFLVEHPILLDVYGVAESKPQFIYPDGESPLGKQYVEPDFLFRYPGNEYKLVELERPGKRIATRAGQPRSEFTQAAFQIGEWRAYIQNHYDALKAQYPGISGACSYTLVIGRSSLESIGDNRDIRSYIELLRATYPGVDIFTYDDLVERAKSALLQLAALISEQPGGVQR